MTVAGDAHPYDEQFIAALAAHGLEPRPVGTDPATFDPWFRVDARGFLDADPPAEKVAFWRTTLAGNRMTGVYDRAAARPDDPVATIASWIGELSVPGDRVLPSWAISSVTVAPTHRRRGLARAMVESELRAAAGAGVAVAMLTASEAPLYGRYGFAAAARAATLRIDVKRATWTGPVPAGRVDFIERGRLRELIGPLHDRVRPGVPGEVSPARGEWDQLAGSEPGAKDAGRIRCVQYAEAGRVDGLAIYSVTENEDDFTHSSARVHYLLTATDAAYAGLWRFFVEMDLIGELTADLRSVDEPLLWMISDQRAVTVTPHDHQYVRILDVPAALSARAYGAAGLIALDVSDPLGYAAGRWLMRVSADGRADVGALSGDAPSGAVAVELDATALAAMYLGGVPAGTLVCAGRVHTPDPAALTRIFGWHTAPVLTLWY